MNENRLTDPTVFKYAVEEDSRFMHVPLLYSIITSLQQAKERSADDDGGLQHMRDFIASSSAVVSMHCPLSFGC